MHSRYQALLDALPLTEQELQLDRLSADKHAVGLLAVADRDVFAWLPYSAPTTVEQMRQWIETVSRLPERRIPLVEGQVASNTSYHPDPSRGHAEIGSTWLGNAMVGQWDATSHREAGRTLRRATLARPVTPGRHQARQRPLLRSAC